MADLELLHNYTTLTYVTISQRLSMREFFRHNIVQMGFRHEYIMRTLLAISALHLAHHRKHWSEYYVSLALSHHQAASRTAVDLMTNVTSENAPMLYVFSNLTMYFALAAPRQESDFLLIGESGFPDWMFLLRGIKLFHPYLQDASKTEELSPLLQDGGRRWVTQHSVSLDATAPPKQQLDHIAFLIQETLTKEEDAPARKIYLDAIEKLERTFAAYRLPVPAGEDRHDIRVAFLWLFEVTDDGFLPLLKTPTQEAAVLLTFFAVLLKKSPDQWWVHGWPEHLLAKAYALLDEEHRLWIRWPMEEMAWIPPMEYILRPIGSVENNPTDGRTALHQ
ncbi:putative Zn(2)-C6 fungal-type domain-containing protein [Seiridium unicorne]|uniref:Zn(2)-C6 fungal-type domain-containing protein n=1 Tax=Seiridium unicorne TaxID=138068 RepID=A0ABR2V3U6_9PEZI